MMNANKIRKNYDHLRSVYGTFGLTVSGDVSFMAWLAKEEKALQGMNERRCNYGSSKGGETKYDNRCADTIKAIETAMPELAGLVTVNGDPRGAALKVTPYVDIEGHDSRHGCDPYPPASELIQTSRIARDWGGYGMLAPQYQVG